jgi:redox-sensitive bicupin YhaK (pirin superfamily)
MHGRRDHAVNGEEGGMTMQTVKKVLRVYQSGSTHWVGDGFHVRNLFPSNDLGQQISPFLLLDYAGPTDFPPTERPRGVGEHPHRGFETVSIVYQGELEHRDSAGNHGTLGPGDVQWMTAASGVVHEEMQEKGFAKRGGTVEMVQLWVNLPRAFKMSPPRYQTLLKAQIPIVDLPEKGCAVRVIAGDFHGVQGPAKTFTPINLYDLRLKNGNHAEFTLPSGHNTGIFLLKGHIVLNGSYSLVEAELALFDAQGEWISIEAKEDATLLVLNGEPIREPVAREGPFVMNTQEELVQAVNDYRMGKMGRLH